MHSNVSSIPCNKNFLMNNGYGGVVILLTDGEQLGQGGWQAGHADSLAQCCYRYQAPVELRLEQIELLQLLRVLAKCGAEQQLLEGDLVL